ncbi:MAG: transposase [Tannerella sp.]|nr:transposase [Tannerella sp.]
MTPEDYFNNQQFVIKKKYDALYKFFKEKLPASQVAEMYGYTKKSFYSLIRDFRKHLKEHPDEDFFFKEVAVGRKPVKNDKLKELIIKLRKKNFSVENIVSVANSLSYETSYRVVYQTLCDEGFARLPRRSAAEKKQLEVPKIKAPEAIQLDMKPEKFHSSASGLFAFLPVIYKYGIHRLIERSAYPSTTVINKLSSILCFLALKLSGIKRYSHDDLWCMDRGMGLFAGLNVLPKTAWFSGYSSRVDGQMNCYFLKELHKIWVENGLLSDTVNLDFTTIPYWGDDAHLENNWSGKRGKALSSMPAVLAQDPQSGIIDYGNTNVMHRNESAVVLEYLDFYKTDQKGNNSLKYLIFDSKFTNYENLSKLDDRQIKFITIRRRGEKMLEKIRKDAVWKTIRVETNGLKKRSLKVYEQNIELPGYKDAETGKPKTVRQTVITGNGKTKPAVMLSNDFDLPVEAIVRKYARRWLVEKGISEQTDFFHLNRLSSSMVIKVDFDLVMSILAHNLYRLLAMSIDRYQHMTDERIYEKFIANSGDIVIEEDQIRIDLKKKRELPALLDFFKKSTCVDYPWLGNKKIVFNPTATS